MKVVGFTGLKGSGKDTAAAVLVELGGFHNVKMAGGLKVMLSALLAYRGADRATIHRMLDGDLKEAASPFLSGRTMRHAMQTVGTEWGRDLMASGFWTDTVRDQVAQYRRVVITDIRFPNEVDLVRSLGGTVWRVERGLAPHDPHPSEALVLGLDVDGVIANQGTVADLQIAVRDRFLPL